MKSPRHILQGCSCKKRINKDKVKAQVYRLGRQVRDAWINWPSRMAAQMASELKVDEHDMHTILERFVREHLDELSDTKLPAGDDG